jgi:hypothetical protein
VQGGELTANCLGRLMRIAVTGLCLQVLSAGAAVDAVEALKKDMPRDVIALIDRHVECAHWSGEEPYDAERRKEIEAAVARLRCMKLDADEKRILKKYLGNEKVLRSLKTAREMQY